MNDIKVSIIVPIYKVPERFLRQCIESLTGQTLREIEIILVDDGSPDRCGAICDEYAKRDARVRVIHKENGGLAAARNSGQDVAVGECVMFVDGDDYLELDCCERAYKALKEKNVQLVFFNIMTEYANSHKPYKTFGDEELMFDERQCKELQVRVLDFKGKIAQAFAKLIRRYYLVANNVRHIDYLKQGAEGFVFNIALFEHLESAFYLPAILYHYIYNEQSISHTPNEENYYLIVRCFEYIEEFIQGSKNKDMLRKQLLNRMLYIICTTAITGYFNPVNKVPLRKKIQGMEKFLNVELIKTAMLRADKKDLDLQRRVVLWLIKVRQWWVIALLGYLRRTQLGNR